LVKYRKIPVTIKNRSGKFPRMLLLGKSLLLVLPILWLFNPFAIASDLSDPEPKRVLIIYSYHEGLPWERLLDDSLRATLALKSTEPIELNVEHADRIRYPGDAYLQNFIDLIRRKYSHPKMDVVIGVDDEATDILLQYGEELFPGVPIVFVTAERKTLKRDSLKPNMTSLLWGADIQGAVNLILKMLPKTRQILVITGSSLSDRAAQKFARAALSGYSDRLEINYLEEISRKDLMDKVVRLPERSVLLYLAFSRDSEGKNFVPLEILSDISRKATVPAFGMLDTYLGFGIVGGLVVSAEDQGRRCAEICLRILNGESPVDIVSEQTPNIMMFDQRQLNRWGIGEERLPADSIVRYREFSIWQEHRKEIIGLIVAGLILSSIIFLLWVQWIKRRHSEAAAHESEVKYRTVADYTYDWEYWMNLDGTFNYVSPSCERISGYTAQEFMDSPSLFREIIVPEDKGIYDEHFSNSREGLNGRELQFRIKRRDGEIRWIEHVCQPVLDEQGNYQGVRASNRDITQRQFYKSETHQLQSELAHMDRIVSMNALTSALAHEINQPLAAMRSYAQAALRFMDKDQPEYNSVRKALQGIVADNKRAAGVINRLRDLTKKETRHWEPIEINSIINDVKSLINSEIILRNASITLDLHPSVPVVQGDSIQIQQVLINLLTNALDAMDDQPIDLRTITISTRFENSNGIIVSVSDSGGGIPPDTFEDIFSPFHTTKNTGMGLGLSICKSIIKTHGGKIWAENNPDGGAVFSLILPIGSHIK